MRRTVFVFFLARALAASQMDPSLLDETHLIGKILKNEKYCVQGYEKNKIFLDPLRVSFSSEGPILDLNGQEFVQLPFLRVEDTKYVLEHGFPDLFSLKSEGKKVCRNCLESVDIEEQCTNSQCPFYGFLVEIAVVPNPPSAPQELAPPEKKPKKEKTSAQAPPPLGDPPFPVALYVDNASIGFPSNAPPAGGFIVSSNTSIGSASAPSLFNVGSSNQFQINSSGIVTTPQYNLSGSSTGTISILPQADAGTFNFNLPITAGTAGYVLTSGGGGSAPMTWTDLGAASVTSVAGTVNQIAASSATGDVTLSFTDGISIGSYQAISPPTGGIICPGNIGAGTFVPQNRLDVSGAVAIGTYAGVNTAPTNGLLVSGNTSIGSNTATSLFNVGGSNQFQVDADGITSAPQYNLNGSTSGTIFILPQAVAGTFNFNLPTTAGSSGFVLTSGGGGSNPMTWTDPSASFVTSVAGTANQIAASSATGDVTLSFTNGISIGSYQATAPPTGGIICPGNVSIGANSATSLFNVGTTNQFQVTTAGVTSAPQYNLNGSTSGTISILPQAVAGTFNFNLPTTAGSTGFVLTSGGGGAAPMTWTDPSAAFVTSVAGTANQIAASSATGDVTLSFTDGISIGSYQATSPPTGGIICPGNVGIGTNNPNAQVEIANSNPNPRLRFTDTDDSNSFCELVHAGSAGVGQFVINAHGATSTALVDINALPDVSGQAASIRCFRTTNTSGSVLFQVLQGDNTVTAAAQLSGNSNQNSYVCINGGDFGIGSTTTGGSKTYILGDFISPTTNNAEVIIASSDAAAIDKGGTLGFIGQADVLRTFAVIGGLKENSTASDRAGYMPFFTRVSGGNLTEKMRITSTGNVGIGTIDPGNIVEIAGAAPTVEINATSGDPGIKFTEIGANRWIAAYSVAGNYIYIRDEVNARDLLRLQDNNVVSIPESTTKVGIGTTSPGAKLEIADGAADATKYGSLQITRDATNNGNNQFYLSMIRSGNKIVGLGYIPNTNTAGFWSANDVSATPAWIVDSSANVGIGTTTVPHGGIGAAKFAMDGTNGSSAAGPHVQYTTSTDDYPVFQQLNWSHDNINLNFDAYYDGTWRSSDVGSNFGIAKNTDLLVLRYASGHAQGAAVTWSNGLTLDTSGNVDIPNGTLSVAKPRIAILRDVKTSGTPAGGNSVGYQTRTLNNEYDPDGIVTLSSNQFTLGAGTYIIEARAPAYSVNRHQIRIYNVTDSVTLFVGSSQYSQATTNVANDSVIPAQITTLASGKTFRLDHYMETVKTVNGLGVESSSGEIEVYSEVVIRQIN